MWCVRTLIAAVVALMLATGGGDLLDRRTLSAQEASPQASSVASLSGPVHDSVANLFATVQAQETATVLAATEQAGALATRVATPAASGGDFAGLVEIGGGRRLWLECRGTGSPTVILESGYPNSGEVWDAVAIDPASGKTAVLPGVAQFTRVCAYDRPGTLLPPDRRGRSDPVPMPRTAADAVADLHALLRAAGVPDPYVLVGHSLGGIILRLYAATYPDEVAGLVLIDASHEEQNVRFQAALTPQQWAAFERLQQAVSGPDDGPELERFDFDASFAQLHTAAAAHPLPPLPLVVLTRGVPLSAEVPPEMRSALPEDFPWANFDTVWQELQAELAALVPGARHVIAAESGHYVQLDQPDLVIEAVRQVVEAVRDPASGAAPAATPRP